MITMATMIIALTDFAAQTDTDDDGYERIH
jgi:hypothetical protein